MSDMRYRQLGRSGLTVSVVGLGCNNVGRRLDLAGTRSVVGSALDAGVTLLDTADIYGNEHDGGSERLLGRVLRGRRDDVVLATKFGMDMGGANGRDWGVRASRRYIKKAVEASLHRLQTDYLDLYQLHEPDPSTPIAETLAALDELVTEGKVRYIGSSNFAGWQVADAHWTAATRGTTPFVSAQNHYNLLTRDVEADVAPACEHFGLGLLPFFPLASGLLSGKYRRGEPAPAGSRLEQRPERLRQQAFDVIEPLEAFATERGISLLHVAIGGLAAQPAVASVIAGATSVEQVAANVEAGMWQPSPAELARINEIAPGPGVGAG